MIQGEGRSKEEVGEEERETGIELSRQGGTRAEDYVEVYFIKRVVKRRHRDRRLLNIWGVWRGRAKKRWDWIKVKR